MKKLNFLLTSLFCSVPLLANYVAHNTCMLSLDSNVYESTEGVLELTKKLRPKGYVVTLPRDADRDTCTRLELGYEKEINGFVMTEYLHCGNAKCQKSLCQQAVVWWGKSIDELPGCAIDRSQSSAVLVSDYDNAIQN